MAFYLDKKIVANSRAAKSQWDEVLHRRKAFEANENHLGNIHGMTVNAAARIPQDVYREMDSQTKQLMTGDEGGTILDLLMPLARSINVGKIVSEYRQAGDAAQAQSSISGQLRKPTDKVEYDYDGSLVLIHDSAVSREWRELEAMRSEDFDGLIDDQAAAVRAVRRQLVDNFLNGSDAVYKGTSSYGIKNSPNTQALNLGAAGLNIDLTSSSTTFAEIEAVFIAALKTLQGTANNVDSDITFAVSADIWFNLMRRGSNDNSYMTFLERLSTLAGVSRIVKTNGTNALTGNEFIAMAANQQYIQPIVGMGMTTTPLTRLRPYDDYVSLVWTAAGLQIKADAQGRSGVLYAREIS